MKERPILFITPMVQAILNGSKTMTRRVVKPKTEMFDIAMHKDGSNKWPRNLDADERFISDMSCPYGKPGDILWVKETFTVIDIWWDQKGVQILYEDAKTNTVPITDKEWAKFIKWNEEKLSNKQTVSSLFMFKSMSRIRLLIKSIRVERLQDITEEDAKAEGWGGYFNSVTPIDDCAGNGPRTWFKKIWQSINGLESWEANPWVWVIEFEKI